MKEITIYTDGGADPNPGRGGYGIVLRYGPHVKEMSQGYKLTTNNRMEVLAAIVALEALKEPGLHVRLHSDSRYLVDAIEKGWLRNWQAKGYKKVKNPDLWQRLAPMLQKHKVTFVWVPGHAGVADNERCDQLSNEARSGPLLTDTGYTTDAE